MERMQTGAEGSAARGDDAPCARVARYTTRPGTLDAILGRAEAGLAPMARLLPGFRCDTLYRTGPDACISVTVWAREEDARRADAMLAGWVRREAGASLVEADSHIGAVTIAHGDPSKRARYAGIGFWRLKPGRLAALTPRLREEYAPLVVARRRGFARYAVVQTGADSAVVFVVYGARADADLPPTPASDTWAASAGLDAAVASVRRWVGEEVWRVRNAVP